MQSNQTIVRLDQLRDAAQNRDLTAEEEKEVISLVRQDRVSAAYISKASKAKTAPIDGKSLLANLFGPKA